MRSLALYALCEAEYADCEQEASRQFRMWMDTGNSTYNICHFIHNEISKFLTIVSHSLLERLGAPAYCDERPLVRWVACLIICGKYMWHSFFFNISKLPCIKNRLPPMALVCVPPCCEWVISRFNDTSTPKGSYSAKTGVNCPKSLNRVH